MACNSDWNSIDFDNAGKKCVKTFHRSLMEKSSSYRNWRSVTSRGYFIQPKLLIQSYLQEISSRMVANSEREIEWSKTINLARQCFLGNAAVIVDTRGGMYSPLNKIDKRTVSFLAVAMGLAASCSAKGENFAYTFRKPQGFTRHDFNMSLLDTINRIRSSFSDYPKIDEIFNHIRISFKESNPQTVIYVGANRPKYTKSKTKSEFKSPLLIWWHITSKKVSFEKLKWEKKDLVIISGFTRDIYNYLMMYGNYNPHTTVKMVTQGTNSK